MLYSCRWKSGLKSIEAQISLVNVLRASTNSAVKHPRNFNYLVERVHMHMIKICQRLGVRLQTWAMFLRLEIVILI